MALRKFKFVEEFIDPATGQPYEGISSPVEVETKFFGRRKLHQIAKISYSKKEIKEPTWRVDKESGKLVKGAERSITTYVENMGEIGGWIEKKTNLSQDGQCWNKSGVICGDAIVAGDVQIGGGKPKLNEIVLNGIEIGDNAKVSDNVEIRDGVKGIGGHAYVHGNAVIQSTLDDALIISGHADVAGTMRGSSRVGGNARIESGAELEGNCVVGGSAMVFGRIEGTATVYDSAIVYGRVRGNAEVGGNAVILKTGEVSDNAVVSNGILAGKVSEGASIGYPQPFVGATGVVSGKGVVGGNSIVFGRVANSAAATGNSRVAGTVETNGLVMGNTSVSGRVAGAMVSGNSIVSGKCSQGGSVEDDDGVLVTVYGDVGGMVKDGSPIVSGKVNGTASGSSIVSGGAILSGSASGNSKIGAGDFVGKSFDNSISLVSNAGTIGGNIVVKSVGAGRGPTGQITGNGVVVASSNPSSATGYNLV